MKGKGSRQSHKATNTYKFQGFGEKVRGLRASARKYLLQRPKNLDGEEITFFYEAINKTRDLCVTQDFTTFLRELGNDVQTVNQLVLHEDRVVQCLSDHISKPDSSALQPLFDLLVAFSNDLPQDFYTKHFYHFLSKLVAFLKVKDPELIESVFLCIVSLFVVLQKYLREDVFTLYHTHDFSALLSKSYPWYINELAAQSLGVLVRKVPNKDVFITLAFKKLKKDATQAEGLGRVFASMIKSDIIQRLHSCTPKVLSKLFEFLKGDDEVPQEVALTTVKHTATLVARYVTAAHPDKSIQWESLWKEDCSLVWPTLWKCVQDLLSHTDAGSRCHLDCILQVIQVFITHRQGALITDIDDTVKNCLAVVKSTLPDDVGLTVIEILAILLQFPCETVPPSALQEIISTFLSSSYSHDTKFTFMKQVVQFDRFDEEILPLLLPHLDELLVSSEDPELHKGVMEFIATLLVKKQPPCASGMDLLNWKAYPLNFSRAGASEGGSIGPFLESKIKEGLLDDFSNLEELSLYLLSLPHISHLDHQDLAPYLTWILDTAINSLGDEARKVVESDRPSASKKRKSEVVSPAVAFDMNMKSGIPLNTRRILFLIGLVIEVMAHIFSREDFLASLSQLELVDLMKRKQHYRENIHILRAVDIHFTVASLENQESVLKEEYLQEIYSFLAPSLSSANPQVRLLVLHIFSLFPVTLPPPPENVDCVQNVFQIMLKAESLAVTPWELRDRLRYITMVDADHVKPHLPISGVYNQAPLLFLIGQLYVNFKDIWNPLLRTIAGFAESLPVDVFWPIWCSKLKIASHLTHEVLHRKPVDPETGLDLACGLLADVNDMLSLHPGYAKLTTKPDHLNFRDLLWRAMEKFPDICETKNRDLVPLFFDFLEKEFFPLDFSVAPSQDIRTSKEQENASLDHAPLPADEATVMEVDEKPSEEEINEDDESQHYPKRASVKSLCEQLRLFSKFHNPRMVTQSKKLENIYQELLTHPCPGLQSLSLDCLMTYNHAFLTPYKEQLSNLIDGQSFKNTLTLFAIEGEDKTVVDDHRKDFMPYLMRVLYGKMYSKSSNSSAGKKAGTRKAVILNFLAGASDDEFQTFLDLAFDVLLDHLDGNAMDVIENSKKNLNLQKVVPLNRLNSALSTMENILERVANRMTARRPLLLKILLYIANTSTLILERRDEVRNISQLKSIRQHAQKLLVTFFSVLEDYSWQPEEIDAVFECMVWPNLKRLPDEGLLSPTPLLNLFVCCSENPRYFPILAKVHKDDSSLTPLTYITKVVVSEKCSKKVKKVVFGMIEKLLTLEDHNEAKPDEEGRLLPLVACPPSVEVTRLTSRKGSIQQNYGSALLMPHLEGLLQSMKMLLRDMKKGIKVTQRDLTILTSLTEWVTSKAISKDLVSLIIPLIVKKHVKEDDVISELLTTCSYLLPLFDDCKEFVHPLITLFGSLTGRKSRIALCLALEAIATVNTEFKELSDMASDLNAWSTKMVDEPDFDKRLDAFKRLGEYCKNADSISLEHCYFIVFNNIFIICHERDVSLRDMSRLSLDQLIDMCVRLQPEFPSEVKMVLINRLLSQVRVKLRQKNEETRKNMFFLLQKIVHKCHSFYDNLQDLYKLADEAEEEGDFFSNMMHIQRHRQARALHRLAVKIEKGTICLSTETIMDYLMPVVQVHIFNTDYAKDDYLVTSSVQCLGAFASVFPWDNYVKLLNTYLTSFAKVELNFHKLGVRILDTLINAFHEEVEEVKMYEKKSKVPGKTFNKGSQKDNVRGVSKGTDGGDKIGKELSPDVEDETGKEISSEEKATQENSEEKDKLDKKASTEISDQKDMKEIELADMPVAVDEEGLSKPQEVYLCLVRDIIPRLKRTLGSRSLDDMKHKVNRKGNLDEDDIKRIPLAFAIIKLMKKLPAKVLNSNLSSVLMKIMAFLRSHLQDIRDEARTMLVKIMVDLGGKYLSSVVSDLRSILTRGFQTHVLVFTLHAILSRMQPVLCATDVDSCLVDIMEICKQDMLGVQDEEKKVAKITTKVREARITKSYAVLNFVSGIISATSLGDLILPLKDILAATEDKSVVNKIVVCLTEISKGLERNENVDLIQKSVFIYGILNEKISLLTDSSRKGQEGSKKPTIERVDYRLLEPAPKRARLIPKATLRTTSHLFIEFALRLFTSLLRREKFIPEDKEHLKLLDPYIVVLDKCLSSEYPEISQFTLKCLHFLVKFPLPSLKTHLNDMCSKMFVILHKFSSPELTKGKISELVQLTFKSLAHVIKTVDHYNLNPEQVRVLLQYVQEWLDDGNHQTTVFAVLQSVVARKIDVQELHELMETVKKMSVSCTRSFALNQARMTYYSYLLTYPMKKKVICRHIMNYLGNVSYSIQDGRLSAQTFINGVVTNFPVTLFTKEIETSMWLKLSEQMVREQFKENRILLHKSLKTLFERSERKSYLLDLCVKLLDVNDSDDRMESSAVAVQLSCKSLSAFLDAPLQKMPQNMLSQIGPKVVFLLNPARYGSQMRETSVPNELMMDESGNNVLQEVDNALVMLMEVFSKLVTRFISSSGWKDHVSDDVWSHVQSLLLYPHIQVRLNAVSLVGLLLAACPVEGPKVPCLCTSTDKARSLVLDLCEVLQTDAKTELAILTQISLSVVRNLIYLIRNARRVSLLKGSEVDDDGEDVKKTDFEAADENTIEQEREKSSEVKEDESISEQERVKSNDADDNSKGTKETDFEEPNENIIEEEKDPVAHSALWVLGRVGNLAYRELKFSGKKCTVIREALLNLIAGIVVVVGEKLQTPGLLNYIIKHFARELSDEKLPEKLSSCTLEVANLVKDQIGVEVYARHFTSAKVALSVKRLSRRVVEKQEKMMNPDKYNKMKKKKRKAGAISKKLAFAEKKGKVISKKSLAKLRASAIVQE